MTTSGEVFRPSNGPLILRGAIATGAAEPMDSYKKAKMSSSHGSRPATSGASSRFGSLSHHSFFARHNPHPGRVRHIKGLLDVPICSVNDDGFFANPRYSAQFPPNSHDSSKINTYRNYNIPAGAINVNTQKYPINTITGLQFFLGKPMNFRVFRDRPQPKQGISCPSATRQVPVNEAWRDELKALTEALGIQDNNQQKPQVPASNKATYSETTGRLIPPPSRAMSRGMSRGGIPGSRMQTRGDAAMTGALQSMGMDDINDDMVLNMLCQILQTEDVSSVQQWLVGAGDNEKSMVLDMIKSALDGGNEPEIPQKQALMDYEATTLKEDDRDRVIGDDVVNEKIDRLTLDPPTPLPRPPSQKQGRCSPTNRPFSQQNGGGRPNSKLSQNGFDNPVKMRYVKTPQPQQHRIAEEDEERRTPSNLGGLPTVTFAGGEQPHETLGNGTLPPINN